MGAVAPNCAAITGQHVTSGYWGIYAAKYATPYKFDVDIRRLGNEVLDSRSQIVTSRPLRWAK